MSVLRKNRTSSIFRLFGGRYFLSVPYFFCIVIIISLILSCDSTNKNRYSGIVVSIDSSGPTIQIKHNEAIGQLEVGKTDFRLYKNVNLNDFSIGDSVSFDYIFDSETSTGYTKNYRFLQPTDIYSVKGVLLDTDSSRKSLIIRHDEIPGFMDAMTMEFKTDTDVNVSQFSIGDSLLFKYLVNEKERYSYTYDFEIVENLNVENDPYFDWDKDPYEPLDIGEELLDASFLDKNGKLFQINKTDKLKFISFIFSRCPDKTMCHAIVENNRYLAERFRNTPNVEFIIVSFDYMYDTPDVINKAYGGIEDRYGNIKFLSSHKNIADLAMLARQIGFRYSNVEKGTQIGHTMKSVIVSDKMILLDEFDGKEWKPYEAENRIQFYLEKYN